MFIALSPLQVLSLKVLNIRAMVLGCLRPAFICHQRLFEVIEAVYDKQSERWGLRY